MNKRIMKHRKLIALLAAVLAMAGMMAGCKQEQKQETQAVETTAATEAVVTTVPEETTAPVETTLPEETEVIVTFPEVEAPEAGSITYAEYLELTAQEQQAYYENFESVDAFFAWLNPAKEEYAEYLATQAADGNDGEENESPIIVGEESLEEWE